MDCRSHDQGVYIGGGGLPTPGVGKTSLEIYGILQDTVNQRAVRILLERILVYVNFSAGIPDQ